MTTIDTIRAEIERRIEAIAKAPSENGVMDSINGARGHELMKLLSFLSTLESEKPMNPDDAMKELDEKIALVKQRGTWDGVDVDKYMDEVRGREPEKPMQEGLEEEIDRFEDWMETYNQADYPTSFTTRDIARHFAKWGAEHTPLPEDTALFNKGVEEGKRLMMENAVKWLVDDDYHEASEKGRFILGSVGLGYNGYYIPYLDLLKLPKED